ncbi:MAG: hypothetical protein AAFV93_16730, partial [Chloroflexota bacterium]
MIEIDVKTGKFNLGDYVIDPFMTYEKLQSKYPSLVQNPTIRQPQFDVDTYRIQFDAGEFLERTHKAKLTYRLGRLSLLDLQCERNLDLSWEDFLYDVCRRVKKLKRYAQSKWGDPTTISPAAITDEFKYLNQTRSE